VVLEVGPWLLIAVLLLNVLKLGKSVGYLLSGSNVILRAEDCLQLVHDADRLQDLSQLEEERSQGEHDSHHVHPEELSEAVYGVARVGVHVKSDLNLGVLLMEETLDYVPLIAVDRPVRLLRVRDLYLPVDDLELRDVFEPLLEVFRFLVEGETVFVFFLRVRQVRNLNFGDVGLELENVQLGVVGQLIVLELLSGSLLQIVEVVQGYLNIVQQLVYDEEALLPIKVIHNRHVFTVLIPHELLVPDVLLASQVVLISLDVNAHQHRRQDQQQDVEGQLVRESVVQSVFLDRTQGNLIL